MIRSLSFPARQPPMTVGEGPSWLEHPDPVERAFRKAHAYKNKLIEICRVYRRRYQETVRAAFPAVDEVAKQVEELETKVQTAEAEIKKRRQQVRKGELADRPPVVGVEPPAWYQAETALPQLRRDLKVARAQQKEIKAAIRGSAELQAATADLQAEEQAAYKAARAQCGLPAATYVTVEQDFQRAKTRARSQDGPRFQRYDGSGRLAVQILAVGGADRLLFEALRVADLHVSAAPVLEAAGRIKLKMGRPQFVGEGGKARDLVEGLRWWRTTPEGAVYAGHNDVAYAAAEAQLTPLRTFGDLCQDGLCGARIEWLSQTAWQTLGLAGRPRAAQVQVPTPGSRMGERYAYGLLHLRIGAGRGGTVVRIRFCCAVDRIPPLGAQMKWVYLHRARVGVFQGLPRYQWRVILTVDDPTPAPRRQGGIVAVNFGWRARPEGRIRVAYWVGDDGAEGEITVGADLVRALGKADDLKAIIDQQFDLAKARLTRYLATQAEIPSWMQENTKGLAQWRGGFRLARLLDLWRSQRLPGDDEIFQELAGPFTADGQDVSWLAKWRHLRSWETGQRTKTLARRKELFRAAAKMLAERYGTLLVEDFDLSEARRKPLPEEGTQGEKTPLVQHMNIAAPGLLRLCMRHAFERRGGEVVVKTEPLATQRCAVCGSEARWDAAKSVVHTCDACGHQEDQDRQNCVNRLTAHGALTSHTSTPASVMSAA